ncbi:histidine kinase [Leifsonia shinshuensis]|uniref:sensor histidine kinase n=1 Tax=Leifsonia shinshuensis TaxID=150026 RepID=UPI002859C626|nr:histidine kinase [Leifsonia shinshuensis]MDR6971518.1 signal transduction histidine kinase [Leifsonia shinshuensis]
MNSVRPSWLSLALTAVGAAAVGYGLLTTHSSVRPPWALALGLVSVALWIVRGLLARAGLGRAAAVCSVVIVLIAAPIAAVTDGLTIVPAAVAVVALLGDPREPLWEGLLLGGVGAALVAVGAVPVGAPVLAVLAMMGGMLLGVFGGLSRRQFRVAEEQAALLREREVERREEASRVAIARDLHDVLAHSLGGLVIQLDAVDALLEAGDTASARSRVVAARGLAAEGLGEARRAVAALRDPAVAGEATVAPALEDALADAVATHRSLGGGAELSVTGTPRSVTPAQSAAFQRAAQEALSNARKHAPGQPVRLDLAWQDDRVRLTISNPLAAASAGDGTAAVSAAEAAASALAATGGGHGLQGMRERFAALPAGGSVEVAETADSFTVTVTAVLQ